MAKWDNDDHKEMFEDVQNQIESVNNRADDLLVRHGNLQGRLDIAFKEIEALNRALNVLNERLISLEKEQLEREFTRASQEMEKEVIGDATRIPVSKTL